jgi:very-short-patch-repair endonuclease
MSLKQAQQLRGKMTEAETLFWQSVRNRQLGGYKFRRQVLVGRYIADFMCLECKTIIEIDGGQHNDNVDDTVRDEFLNSIGFVVVRYWNNDVLNNIEGVLSTLTLTLSQRERELRSVAC